MTGASRPRWKLPHGQAVAEVEGFLEHLASVGLSRESRSIYARHVRRWVRWCDAAGVDRRSPLGADVAMFADLMPADRASRRQVKTALRYWFTWHGHRYPLWQAVQVPSKARRTMRRRVRTPLPRRREATS